ncbi:MAG: DUF192 domain-containing protein [Planctomycetota bacterium]|jgi:uncharacterized membrane protein (UPF0127 family)
MSSTRPILLLCALSLLPSLAGCGASEPRQPRPAGHVVEIGGQEVVVEIAADQERRRRGLMYRDGLGENRGMLFIFAAPQPQSFYMKNCRFDIDIAYIDDDGVIVRTYTMRHHPPGFSGPFTYYRCDTPVRYVLEVDGGWLDAHGVKEGDRVKGYAGPESVVVR